jgi:hypothetical protein
MAIPTEPIGSIPRPQALMEAMNAFASNEISQGELEAVQEDAVRDTIRRFQETGSPVITDVRLRGLQGGLSRSGVLAAGRRRGQIRGGRPHLAGSTVQLQS